jgi:hypothetical protein
MANLDDKVIEQLRCAVTPGAASRPPGEPASRLRRHASNGSRLVPYVEGPKRGLKRYRALALSCANTIEVQVNLDGRIHPKPAPHGGG